MADSARARKAFSGKKGSPPKGKAALSARAKPAAKKPTPARKPPALKSAGLKPRSLPSVSASLSFSSATPLPRRVQALVDKSDIADLVHDFARGLDRMDETLLRSLVHPDATMDLGPGVFQGTAHDYIHWVLGALQPARSSHHMIGSVRARLEGDTALVESYCQAYFRLDKPTGREDLFMGLRFLDRLERRPAGPSGVWKIVHRKQVFDWARTEAASDIFYHQNPDALWSYRTKTDLSSQMETFPRGTSGGKASAFMGRRYESKSIRL